MNRHIYTVAIGVYLDVLVIKIVTADVINPQKWN